MEPTLYNEAEQNGGNGAESNSAQTPLSSLPRNTPEESRRVEEIVKRVVEEHRETLEKLADD